MNTGPKAADLWAHTTVEIEGKLFWKQAKMERANPWGRRGSEPVTIS